MLLEAFGKCFQPSCGLEVGRRSVTCGDSLLDPYKSKRSATRTWSLSSSWSSRGRGKKCLGVLGNDSADKIEKSRRGNGLDRKRRGPAVSQLRHRFQEDFPSAGTVIPLEMEEQVSGP